MYSVAYITEKPFTLNMNQYYSKEKRIKSVSLLLLKTQTEEAVTSVKAMRTELECLNVLSM